MGQRQFQQNDTDKWKEAFGKGKGGSSYVVPSNEGCSGTISTKSLTLASAGSFANGDLVLIHQTRGATNSFWELNKIASGGGTTSLTMEYDLMNTYTDSGNDQAQIIEMISYKDLSLGAVTAPTWDGSKGGIIAFFDAGKTTLTGALNLAGKGFAGGQSVGNGGYWGYRGEGSLMPSGASSTSYQRQENAAGGGVVFGGTANCGGGGGGNVAYGTAGITGHGSGGQGGAPIGSTDLSTMSFGGGGGSGSANTGSGASGAGGRGGGMAFIFAKEFEITTGSITLNGANGGNSPYGGWADSKPGGGGAGGSCLLKCVTATLGTTKITATKGAGGYTNNGGGSKEGGDGSDGRIHIDYSKSVTGTTSPTLDSTLDKTIRAGKKVVMCYII